MIKIPPSRTALVTSLMRALHSRRDPSPLIDDPWGAVWYRNPSATGSANGFWPEWIRRRGPPTGERRMRRSTISFWPIQHIRAS